MGEVFSVVFIIVAAILSVKAKAAKSGKDANSYMQGFLAQRLQNIADEADAEEAQDAYVNGESEQLQSEAVPSKVVQSFREVTVSAAKPKKFSQAVEKSFRDDLHGDWLANQLREEARIKSRTDLGAVHDASCDARDIKTAHAKAHAEGRIN